MVSRLRTGPGGHAGYDVAVVGGGTAGAAVAARLVQAGATVCLVEAGPDYGPLAAGRWPGDLLDPRLLPTSHDWDPHGDITTSRARVLGGSSAHNGCWVVGPSAADMAGWIAASGGAWGMAELSAAIRGATDHLARRVVGPADLTCVSTAAVSAASALGVPWRPDVNAPDALEGIGAPPLNVRDGVRWNAGFGYLDPLRDDRRLSILAQHLGDRLEWRGVRGVAVIAWQGGCRVRVPADRIVLCAGAYGTPALLLRSGIGPEEEIRRHGIPPVHVLPGVGAGLTDHVGAGLAYAASGELIEAAQHEALPHGFFPSQVVWKSRSRFCPPGTWDQFVLPIANCGERARGRATYQVAIQAFAMRPRSRGRVALASTDPSAPPLISANFLSDRGAQDLRVLRDAITKARALAATPELGRYLDTELLPGADADRPAELAEYLRQAARGYWHATGTCALLPAGDPASVAGPDGRVHGLENVHVADASLLSVPPSGNTHLPVLAVAELVGQRIARQQADRLAGPAAAPSVLH